MVFAGVQYVLCNAARNQISKRCFETYRKFPGSGISRNTRTYKLRLSALRVFKTPEITSMAELYSSEAGANDFSTE